MDTQPKQVRQKRRNLYRKYIKQCKKEKERKKMRKQIKTDGKIKKAHIFTLTQKYQGRGRRSNGYGLKEKIRKCREQNELKRKEMARKYPGIFGFKTDTHYGNQPDQRKQISKKMTSNMLTNDAKKKIAQRFNGMWSPNEPQKEPIPHFMQSSNKRKKKAWSLRAKNGSQKNKTKRQIKKRGNKNKGTGKCVQQTLTQMMQN